MNFKIDEGKTFVLLMLVVSMAIGFSYAQQQTGAIGGTVKDDTGEVVPGVTVEIRGPTLAGGIKSEITTTSGTYLFRALPPGTYTAIFSLQGLKTVEKKGIIVSKGKTTTVDIVLKLTTVEESVTVIDKSPVVDETELEKEKPAISRADNKPPSAGTISPSRGSSLPGQEIEITSTCSDPNGHGDLRYIMIMINTDVDPSDCCYIRYNIATGKFYLMNDSGTEFLFSDQNNLIQNSYAKLDCSKTEVTYQSDYTVKVKWLITFMKPFSGNTYNTYMHIRDKSGERTNWLKKGTWRVEDQAP